MNEANDDVVGLLARIDDISDSGKGELAQACGRSTSTTSSATPTRVRAGAEGERLPAPTPTRAARRRLRPARG